ncbi:hypothetical protein [Chamaesiphon sp. VAR_69_metabat_338]|uniref:hypothetical protein n=1 Tax=Chamaesiphon sp. VAR_69_metabat_338 TaxID=2964704 RepID=UPI00286E7A34|nr:hypothetical protein [Chamaesiphon sp. VAR_69_metabat_338]
MKATSSLIEPISGGMTPPPKVDTSFSVVSSTAILLAVATAIAACISAKKRQPVAKLEADSAVKCQSCKYFDRNLYLNCALHPSSVMTELAVDCMDYSPNQQTQRVKEWKQAIPFINKIFPN